MKRYVIVATVVAFLGAFAASAPAQAAFHPRVRGALGLIPTVNKQGVAFDPDIATGAPTEVTYHGGSVMANGVTVHTIFWDGGTNSFPGSPRAGAPTYQDTITQLFGDIAADSTGTSAEPGACDLAHTGNCNVFSVLPGYAEGTTAGNVTPGNYSINYDAGNPDDLILDHDPYPAVSDQCNSAQATEVCVTDGQVAQEIDSIAPTNERGLNNIWFVFLPPGVDECIAPQVCGTNDYEAYHSDFNLNGHGVTIYAVGIDPIIEVGPISQGSDPNGNADAESTADAAAHETVEAMTDPQGVGWMDPNGFEVADKCESGSQFGTPLGFAGPDHAEYNQLINGFPWLIQDMWSNNANNGEGGCVQATTSTANPLPLPQVNLTQFSTQVTGNTETAGADGTGGVTVSLLRCCDAVGNPVTVAHASGTIQNDGSWSVTLPLPVGDDRDEINVDYTGAGAPTPAHEVILTGNGGNPFTESGWTGWTAMDNGVAVTNSDPDLTNSVTLSPCFQTGVLEASINGTSLASPTDFCDTQSGAATVTASGTIGAGDVVTTSSNDNRGFAPPDVTAPDVPNPAGMLVRMTVPAGEADAVSQFSSPMAPFFTPTGFPTCTADLEFQQVSCSGLVADFGYTLNDGAQHVSVTSDGNGELTRSMTISRGDVVGLSNGARTVTSLHVANLRVDVTGSQTVLSGGSCQAGQYYGPGLTDAPTNGSAGDFGGGGAALTGEICPSSGLAAGLPTDLISQTDQQSLGSTQTEVPDIEDTSPMQGETMVGTFTALAESGLPNANNSVFPTDNTSTIALSIAPASGGSPVATVGNVDTATGVAVSGLAAGTYTATWTLTDANGDTRTATTRFIEQAAVAGPKGDTGPQGATGPKGDTGPRGPQGPPGPKPRISCHLAKHHKIRCTVTFPKAPDTSGAVKMAIARGSRVVALGHGSVQRGHGTVTLRSLGHMSRGRWTITIVLSRRGKATRTTWMTVRVR